MAFDRQICIDNIYYLAKQKGIKMGDLETSAGVSPGYFSRQNKEGNKSSPSIEVLASVSEQLGIPVDSLISVDYTALTSSERYVVDFLNRLIERTSSFELIWDQETEKALNDPALDENGDPYSPLLENRRLAEGWQICYLSRFVPCDEVSLSGNSYSLRIAPRTDLYLMSVEIHEDGLPIGDKAYELYLHSQNGLEALCYSKQAPFTAVLSQLYALATESSHHIKLSDTAKSVIDKFMNGSLLDEDDGGELPF